MEVLLRLKRSLFEFNLFQTHTPLDTNPTEKKIQVYSTRLLIFLLVTSLLILLIYTSQLKISQTNTITSPSVTKYSSLEETYGDRVICPCTNIAIKRKDFLSLTPNYHQVCSSDFNSDRWLTYLRTTPASVVSTDFRYVGSVLFGILASFCRLANRTITDSLPNFYSTRYISSKMINVQEFNEEIQSIIDRYISTSSTAFAQSFKLIRDISYTNGLISGLQTNFRYYSRDYNLLQSTYEAVPVYQNYDQCSCELTPSCIQTARIGNNTNNGTFFIVPGLYTGCYLIEAMRLSNLNCFYNQTCLNQLMFYLQSTLIFNATAMIQFNTSRFNPLTQISDILAVLMVDLWIQNISYTSYFTQCQPLSCIYTTVQRHDAIYIITTVIGIFGGLYKSLSICVPIVVKFIINRRQRRRQIQIQSTADLPVAIPHSTRLAQITQWIRSFNLFPSYPPSTDPYQLKTERVTTIVYVLSLTISLLILISYTANETIIETITISTPSLDTYRHIYEKHALNTLSCPCSTITSEYGQFLTLTPTYHQFCSSNFVGETWLNSLNTNRVDFYAIDLRRSASLIFHSLASYCSLLQESIVNQLILFQSSSLITSNLLTEDVFHAQMNTLIESFTQSIGQDFIQQLQFLRTNIYGNQLINGLMSNFILLFQDLTPNVGFTLTSFPIGIYGDCYCDISPKCSLNIGIYDMNDTNPIQIATIPGLRMGCYTNEALLQSTLECFYNQTCIDLMKFYLNLTLYNNVHVLNSSRSTRFNRTTVIENLINNFMIEQWMWNDSFSNYYQICQPSTCSYKRIIKTPFIIVITTLISLFGGLMKIFQIIIPIIVQFFRRSFKRTTENNEEQVRIQWTDRIRQYKVKLFHFIRTFNLFRTKTALDDQIDNSRIQIISTRLYILLLIISMGILLSYTSQVEVTRTLTIDSPSFSSYWNFSEKYGEKVTCPCTKIVTSEDQFLSIIPRFHQICSSDFIDPSWPQGIRDAYVYTPGGVYNRDFRFRSPYYFQSLQSFCQLANRSLTSALDTFYSSSFVSTNLFSQSLFSSQINANIDLFITSTINTFTRSFRVLRDTTYNNNFVSTTLSSLTFSIVTDGNVLTSDRSTWQVALRYKLYNQSRCSCRDTPTCVEEALIYTLGLHLPLYSIPGILIGCYIFEALLQSDLHFFYNQTNVDWLRETLNITGSKIFHALDPVNSNGFSLNEPIERILERMMINQWKRNISYENYFDQCQPSSCRYSYVQRFDLLYMITSITALIGGLTSALQLVIPRLVRLIRLHHC